MLESSSDKRSRWKLKQDCSSWEVSYVNDTYRGASTLASQIRPLRCFMASTTAKLIGCLPVTRSCSLFPSSIAVQRISNHTWGNDGSLLLLAVALLFAWNNIPINTAMNVQALELRLLGNVDCEIWKGKNHKTLFWWRLIQPEDCGCNEVVVGCWRRSRYCCICCCCICCCCICRCCICCGCCCCICCCCCCCKESRWEIHSFIFTWNKQIVFQTWYLYT